MAPNGKIYQDIGYKKPTADALRVSYGVAFFFSFYFANSSIMAEDVSKILEKMTLTLEEEETITISDEGQRGIRELCFESYWKIFNLQIF